MFLTNCVLDFSARTLHQFRLYQKSTYYLQWGWNQPLKIRVFFLNKSQEKAGFERMILANWEILPAKVVWDTWHKTVMPWTRLCNLPAPPNTASDLFHLDKQGLMAVLAAGQTLRKNEVSAIWNAVSCYLELDTAFTDIRITIGETLSLPALWWMTNRGFPTLSNS